VVKPNRREPPEVKPGKSRGSQMGSLSSARGETQKETTRVKANREIHKKMSAMGRVHFGLEKMNVGGEGKGDDEGKSPECLSVISSCTNADG
jgi:hypothetical protein